MANWKLTPEKLGEHLIGFTPKWTSGSGSYRVKRFSHQFPFFAHGHDEVITSAIQLLRWSSKLDPKKDLTVFMNLDGKLIHLFNAQPFVVEYFRRLWLRSSVSETLLFVESEQVDRYAFSTSASTNEQQAIESAFSNAALQLSHRVKSTNYVSAINIFEMCKIGRKDPEVNLETMIDAPSLIALTMSELAAFRKPDEYAHQVIRIHRATHGGSDLYKKSGKSRLNSVRLIKSLNSERSKVQFSDEDMIWLEDTKKRAKEEKEIVFQAGTRVYQTTDAETVYEVNDFGAYYLLEVSSAGNDFTSRFPMKSIFAAKRLIKIIKNPASPLDKRLCFKVTTGVGESGCATIGFGNDAVLDFFADHWTGTPVSYCSFVSMMPLHDENDPVDLIQRVCRTAHNSEIRTYSSG